MSRLRCVQLRSSIRSCERQKRILRSLKLKRVGSFSYVPDCASVRGMIAKVNHLIEVEHVE